MRSPLALGMTQNCCSGRRPGGRLPEFLPLGQRQLHRDNSKADFHVPQRAPSAYIRDDSSSGRYNYSLA